MRMRGIKKAYSHQLSAVSYRRSAVSGSRGHDDEQQRRREERERSADSKRDRRTEDLPDHAEQNARGQRADALHGVVDAERRSTARHGREIRDERLLRALGESEV